MRKITLSFITAIILLCSFTANAVLNMGGKTVFAGTLIKVLEPGSAAQVQAIITSITDATATKPYLIHLGPGVYDLGSTQIVMKEWVSIQGSGQKSTKITGSVGNFSGGAASTVVVGANNAALMDLTIENTGGLGQSLVIFNDNTSPRIERITAIVMGGMINTGVENINSSNPVMTNVTAIASGGGFSTGVRNASSSSPIMTNIISNASGGSTSNTGVRNFQASPTMTNVTASGTGGGTSYGVSSTSSSPVMTNVSASGSGGTSNYGVHIEGTSSPFIKDSALEGTTKGLFIDVNSTGTRVVNSKIIGGVTNNATTGTQCLGNYDASLVDVTC